MACQQVGIPVEGEHNYVTASLKIAVVPEAEKGPLVKYLRRVPKVLAERGEKPLPSIAKQALNYGKAALWHAASLLTKASEQEQKARLAVCVGCEEYRPSDNRCANCGCYLVGDKLAWDTSICPLGKW